MSAKFDAAAIGRQLDNLHEQGKLMEARELALTPWPQMNEDIREIADHILFEARKNGQVHLFIKAFDIDENQGSMTVEMPDWQQPARDGFSERYPDQQEAEVRFRKAITVVTEWFFQVLGMEPTASFGVVEQVFEELFAEVARSTEEKWGTA